MKRNPPSKPRHTIATADFGRPVEVGSVRMSADGWVEFLDKTGEVIQPISGHVERGYERAKGAKVLSQTPAQRGSRIDYNPALALLQYDYFVAIDTNTRIIRDESISVAAFCEGAWEQRVPAPKLAGGVLRLIEFRNADCHPDLYALKFFIEGFGALPTRDPSARIAFIVDSHLGDLGAIRSRHKPVLDQCYLPECSDLLYASDAAQDGAQNVLLRLADRRASELLGLIESGVKPDLPSTQSDPHVSYFRLWTHNPQMRSPT